MLGIAPDLPDALVGIPGVRDGRVDQLGESLPHRLDDLRRPLAEMDVHGVEEHAPHVVLVLVPGAVAHPHRPRVAPAREVVEGLLGQVLPTVDAVHDLQLEVAAPAASASRTKAKYSRASQSKPSRYSERSMKEESRIQV